jgi:hypothetical protein
MDSQVAAVAEDNGIRVLAVAIVANSALAILLLANLGLTIDGGGAARPRPVRLGRLRVGLWYPLLESVPLLLNLCEGNLEDLARDGLELVALAFDIV